MFEAIFQKDHNIGYKDCGVDILDAFRLSLQFLQEDIVMKKINSKECKFVGKKKLHLKMMRQQQ